MPELQFFKTLIFHRALSRLQNRTIFRFFYLKFFSVFIISGSIILIRGHEKIKEGNFELCGLLVVGCVLENSVYC